MDSQVLLNAPLLEDATHRSAIEISVILHGVMPILHCQSGLSNNRPTTSTKDGAAVKCPLDPTPFG